MHKMIKDPYNIRTLGVIIPVRDKDNSRIKKCIKALKKASKGYDIDMVVVDYGSKIPIKLKDTKIIRYEAEEWNKSHLINKAILDTKCQFIMILDVDMLVTEDIIKSIYEKMDEDVLIIDTNVRRVDIRHLNKPYAEMLKQSLPWHEIENRTQLHNQANGGIQVYPRSFWEKIRGIPESLGKEWGAEDSWIYFIARLNGLKIIDLPQPLLHMNHKAPKDIIKRNKEEQDRIMEWINYKARWLDFIVKNKIDKNPEPFVAKSKPCRDLYNKFLIEYENRTKVIQKSITEGRYEFEYMYETLKLTKDKPSVLICVINNNENIPAYFAWDLMQLFSHTKRFYPLCCLQSVNACSIANMRNLAISYALGNNPEKKKYNYVVMLDTDHHYVPNFLVKFLDLMEKNNWDVLTGLTSSKKAPHYTTQYLKANAEPLNSQENTVPFNKIDKIIDIEASGPVGMVINTKIFDKIKFPWFMEQYKIDLNTNRWLDTVGSDIYFSRKLTENGIKIKCDRNTSFPHGKIFFLNRGAFLP